MLGFKTYEIMCVSPGASTTAEFPACIGTDTEPDQIQADPGDPTGQEGPQHARG